jgi:hypothetical protein
MGIKRLTLAFDSYKSPTGDYFATLQTARGRELTAMARSEGKARAQLEQEARLHIGKSLESERNAYARCVIGTNDGHVLTLAWQHETSEYYVSVCGPDRTNASATFGGLETADKAREYMRQYAADCFNGVAWENR